MSEDLFSKPDRTKVKYERGEMEERMVDIYESADTFRSAGPEGVPPRTTAGHQRAESVPPQRRSSRAAAVCVGLLCVLLLAGITGLGLHHITVMEENIRERERIITRNNKTLTELMVNISLCQHFTEDIVDNLTKNMTEMMKEKQYVVKERDALRKTLNICFLGWKTLGRSCYNVYAGWETWEESRQDCRERGADLVIINSREEMDFIHNFGKSYLWIGLSYSEGEGIWKWVDGTPLPEKHKFWEKGQPNGDRSKNCVEQIHYASGSIWNDVPCRDLHHWVCERNTTLYL